MKIMQFQCNERKFSKHKIKTKIILKLQYLLKKTPTNCNWTVRTKIHSVIAKTVTGSGEIFETKITLLVAGRSNAKLDCNLSFSFVYFQRSALVCGVVFGDMNTRLHGRRKWVDLALKTVVEDHPQTLQLGCITAVNSRRDVVLTVERVNYTLTTFVLTSSRWRWNRAPGAVSCSSRSSSSLESAVCPISVNFHHCSMIFFMSSIRTASA